MKGAKGESRHQCNVCKSSFRRAEHLKRHLRSHSSERPYTCATCGKAFARSDILHRHELNHDISGDRPQNRLTSGTFRACQPCATARQRCSGVVPCARCSKKNLKCTFPKGCEPLEATDCADSPHISKLGVLDSTGTSIGNIGSAAYASFSNAGTTGPSQESIRATFTHQDVQPSPYHDRGPSIASLIDPGSDSTTQYPLKIAPASAAGTAVSIVGTQDQHRISQASTAVQWDTNPAFNTNSLPNPSLDALYPQTFDPNTTDMDSDWLNQSLNWIPLTMYPSPYGPDLEAEFNYILPSDASLYGPIDENPNWQSPPSAERSFHPRTMSMAEFSDVSAAQQSFGNTAGGADFPFSLSSQSDGVSQDTRANKRQKLMGPGKRDYGGRIFAFPLLAEIPPQQLAVDAGRLFPEMPLHTYGLIVECFEQICLSDSSVFPTYNSEQFPSLDVLSACVKLYFRNFHQRLPILHISSLKDPGVHWLLWLAVTTIGSIFLDVNEAREFTEALQEMLHRAVSIILLQRQHDENFISVMQCRLLNLIGLSQSKTESHRALIPCSHAALARSLLESGILQVTGQQDLPQVAPTAPDVTKVWRRWISRERRRRTGYFIWLIDNALAYLSNSGPLCSMDDARAPLPCDETLWGAASASEWAQLFQDYAEQPSLCTAIETMYLRKQIPPTLSEMGYILAIHALEQKTFMVGRFLKQPLSDWTPRAKSRGFIATPSKDTFWLPSYPLYESWRNSACDCLDVLQWHITSVVARASAVEHHLMLHVHLARVVLLTPFQEIDDLCSSLLQRYERTPAASFYVHDGSYQLHNAAKLPQIRKITWRWLREDQHKARLGALHAGSVFWHVRRYSSNTFSEPTAIYLASIVLWVYGSYRDSALSQVAVTGGVGQPQSGRVQDQRNGEITPQLENGTDPSNPPEVPNSSSRTDPETSREPSPGLSTDGSQPDHPQFIHLDRPCDDEMVRHFVRHGQKMACHMSNVGDICEEPHKILLEGARLLKSKLWHWGVSEIYYQRLKALAILKKGG